MASAFDGPAFSVAPKPGDARRLSPPRGWRFEASVLLPVLLFGAVVRGLMFLGSSPGLLNNADGVTFIALALDHSTVGDTFHPAGYPIALRGLMSLTGSAWGTIAAQHVLGLVSAAFLYVAVRLLGGRRWVAGVTALVAAASGDQVVYGHTFVSETVFTFGLASAFLLAAGIERFRGRAPLGALLPAAALLGALLVGAAIVRTVGVLLLPVFALWLLGWRPDRRGMVLVVVGALGAALLFFPYVAHRKAETGNSSLSTSVGWSSYGRVAQIADCSRITVPTGARGLCEREPDGAYKRPDVRAYWFVRALSPALRAFGDPPTGDAVLRAFASQIEHRQRQDVWALRVRDVVRTVWPAFAFRRAYQIQGPTPETSADFVWPQVERASARQLESRFGERAHHSDAWLRATERYQAITRVWPPLLAMIALVVAIALVRAPRGARPVLLFGAVAFILIAGGAAIQLYNPRYAVPAQSLAIAAGLLALQALNVPVLLGSRVGRARRRWTRSRTWRWSGRGAREVLVRVRSRTLASASRIPRSLWVVLALGVALRVIVWVALPATITDRPATLAGLRQAYGGLWTDAVDAPASALLLRLAAILHLTPGPLAAVEHVAGLVGAGLGYAVARRLGARHWAALAAAALLAFDVDRVALERLTGASSLGTPLALGSILVLWPPGVRRLGLLRAAAGGALLAGALLHVPGATAIVLLLSVTLALAVMQRRRGVHRRRGLETLLAALCVPVAALGLVAIDRWDVAGGPFRVDATAPFAQYVARAPRVTCPRTLARDLRPLCLGSEGDASRDALAARMRALAPGDAAEQRWLVDRWLGATGGAPRAVLAGVTAEWTQRWIEGGSLRELDVERRGPATAPALRRLFATQLKGTAAIRDPTSESPRLLGDLHPHEAAVRPVAWRVAHLLRIAPEAREGATLGAVSRLQQVERSYALRWGAALVLLALALIALVRSWPARLLALAGVLLACAVATPGLQAIVLALLALIAAVGATIVGDLVRTRWPRRERRVARGRR